MEAGLSQIQSHISLGMLVPWKKWRPNFSHFKTCLKISFTWQKPTEMQFQHCSNIALKVWIVIPVEYFKVFKIHLYFICQPACLPAITPTSCGRIRPVFSHNTKYRCANTDLLFWLRFIHYTIVSPFILHCFSFSMTGEQKGEKLLKKCWWNVWLILITSH